MSRPVFCHYMVGGMEPSQALTDITQAKAMGLDAFALNIISLEYWSTQAVQFLFDAAAQIGFQLFFSFDMTHFTLPAQFFPLLLLWTTSAQYYHFNGLPFVSTFYGGLQTFGEASPNAGWQSHFRNDLAASGLQVYFVPSFSDSPINPSSMYDDFPAVDGLMNWNAWPWASQGQQAMSTDVDELYIQGAVHHEKSYMMSISTHQFKHLDQYENWFRTGHDLLTLRMEQALTLSPSFLEVLTWNDGGESTYIGTVWPDGIQGSPAHGYIDEYPHTGWQILYRAFISAYKKNAKTIDAIVPVGGTNAEGVMWYRPFLATGGCGNDPLGKPFGWENAVDEVHVAVMLSGAAVGSTIRVFSGGAVIGQVQGVVGLNSFSFGNMKEGAVRVEVVGSNGATILKADGTINVSAYSSLCNFNYVVVPLS